MADTNISDYLEHEWKRHVTHVADAAARLDDRRASNADREELARSLLTLGNPNQWRQAFREAIQTIFGADVPDEPHFWQSTDMSTAELRLVLEAYHTCNSPISDADRIAIAPFVRGTGTAEQWRVAIHALDDHTGPAL